MKKYMTIVKGVLILGLLVFIAFDLRGEKSSNAELEDVRDAVLTAAGYTDTAPAENRVVKRFYGLNPKDYEGVVLYAPEDNMDAHELLLVKLADESQSEAVEAAIMERLETQKNSFEGYGAEQTKLLNNYVLQVKGNYIFYMVGENAAKAEEAFVSSL